MSLPLLTSQSSFRQVGRTGCGFGSPFSQEFSTHRPTRRRMPICQWLAVTSPPCRGVALAGSPAPIGGVHANRGAPLRVPERLRPQVCRRRVNRRPDRGNSYDPRGPGHRDAGFGDGPARHDRRPRQAASVEPSSGHRGVGGRVVRLTEPRRRGRSGAHRLGCAADLVTRRRVDAGRRPRIPTAGESMRSTAPVRRCVRSSR